jgi:hypothetical protein
MSGVTWTILFCLILGFIDILVLLQSKEKSLWQPGTKLPRIGAVLPILAVGLLALKRHYNVKKLTDIYREGTDISWPFFTAYTVLVILTSVSTLRSASNLRSALRGYPTITESRAEGYEGFNSIPSAAINTFVNNLLIIYNSTEPREPRVPCEALPPLTVTGLSQSSVLTLIATHLLLRETFGRAYKFSPPQLRFVTLIKVFSLVILVFRLGMDAFQEMQMYCLMALVLYIVPARRITTESQRHDFQSRLAFVRWKASMEEKEALERELESKEAELSELNSKLQLTEAQVKLVNEATEGLEGLHSYKIDMQRDLEFKEKIGEGAFGIVYLATFRGETVAVKQLVSEKIDADSLARFKAEILLLANLHHPAICQILAASWVAPNLAIVLEYAHNGDLQLYLKKYKDQVTWNPSGKRGSRLTFVSNIAHGMRYLHNRSPPVMHRDLKCENCLVTQFHVLKLSDFGESRETRANDADDESSMTLVGTPYFIAPEVIRGDSYDISCDVFSFAIVLCCIGVPDGSVRKVFSEELRAGKQLTKMQAAKLKGMHVSNNHARGWRSDLSSFNWPEKMAELVKACWSPDPSTRPTFDEICVEVEGWRPELFKDVTAPAPAAKQGAALQSSSVN